MYKIICEINDSTCYAVRDNIIFVLKKINASDIDTYKMIMNISSPYIAKHFEFTSIGDNLYVVEEYIKGITLKEYCERNFPLQKSQIVKIATEICSGLNEIHQIGLVHRDITPTNIIIDENGSPKIIDFGICRINKPQMSKDTQILGTVGYAAPEQFGFLQTDKKADIYSMGVLINYMATLKLPNEQLPDNDLGIVVKKCMEMDANKRYDDISKLSNALNKRHFESIIRSIPGFRQGKGWHIIIATVYYVMLLLMLYVLFSSGKHIDVSIANTMVGILDLVLPIPIVCNYKNWINRWSFTSKLPRSGKIAIQGFFVILCFSISLVFILLFQN